MLSVDGDGARETRGILWRRVSRRLYETRLDSIIDYRLDSTRLDSTRPRGSAERILSAPSRTLQWLCGRVSGVSCGQQQFLTQRASPTISVPPCLTVEERAIVTPAVHRHDCQDVGRASGSWGIAADAGTPALGGLGKCLGGCVVLAILIARQASLHFFCFLSASTIYSCVFAYGTLAEIQLMTAFSWTARPGPTEEPHAQATRIDSKLQANTHVSSFQA
jgi:hypothetical protein